VSRSTVWVLLLLASVTLLLLKNHAWCEQKSTACMLLFGCLSHYYKCKKLAPGMSRKTPPANFCCTPQSLFLMLTIHAWCEQKSTACAFLFGCLSHYYKCKKIAPGMSRKTSPANFLLHISVTILMQKHHAKCEEKHRLRAFVGCFSHYYKCKRIVPGMSRKAPPANFCCTPQSLFLMLTIHFWCEQKSTACAFLFGCLSHYYKCKKTAPGMSRKAPPANFGGIF